MRYPLDKTSKLLKPGMKVRVPMGGDIWRIATIRELERRASVIGDHWLVIAETADKSTISAIAHDCIKVG